MIQWVGVRVATNDGRYCGEVLNSIRKDTMDELERDAPFFWKHMVAERFSKQSSRKLILVLDGIDLLGEESFTFLVSLIETVSEAEMHVQFVLASDPRFKTKLLTLDVKCIALTKQKLAYDMRKLAAFRAKELPRLRELRPGFRKVMARKVAAKADTFLYIEHTMRRFNSLRREGLILKELDHLPENITDLYKTLVSECKRNRTPGELEVLRNLFAWLAYANDQLTIGDATIIISIIAKEHSVSIEEELDGRSSRLLRIFGSRDDGTGDDGSSELSDSEDADDKSDDREQEEDQSSNNILGFQERSLRAFFKQANDDGQGLTYTPWEAQAIILKICVAVLTMPQETRSKSSFLVEYAGANWTEHFMAIELEKLSDVQVSEQLEALHGLLSNRNDALKSMEITMSNRENIATVFGPDKERQTQVLERLQEWCKRALRIPPGILSYGVADWYRPLAAEPTRVYITVARSHVHNWFSAINISFALAAFRAAHTALHQGSGLPELQQNPALRQYFEQHAAGDEPTATSFEVVANAFWDVVKTSASHRGIGMAMKGYRLWEPAIAQYDIALSLLDPDDIGERFSTLSGKGHGQWQLAEATQSESDRKEKLLPEVIATLETAIALWDDEQWQRPQTKDGFGETLFQYHAMTTAQLGHFDKSMSSIKRALGIGCHGLLAETCTSMMKSLVDAGQYKGVMELLGLIKDMDRLRIAVCNPTDDPVYRAAKETGQGAYMLQVLDAAAREAGRLNWAGDRAVVLLNGAEFAWRALQDFDAAAGLLRTLIAEPHSHYELVLLGAQLLGGALLERFLRSSVPLDKAAALKELRDLRGKLVQVVEDYDPNKSLLTVPLAIMLRKLGPALEYADVLNGAFRSCVDGLSDDTGGNDSDSLRLLSKVLMCVDGLEHDAQIAFTAQQYILDDDIFQKDKLKEKEEEEEEEEEEEDDDDDDDEKATQPKAGQETDHSAVPMVHTNRGEEKATTLENEIREGLLPGSLDPQRAPVCNMCDQPVCHWTDGHVAYYCIYCVEMDICGSCMEDKLARERGDKPANWRVLCPQGHWYVKGPVEGWRGVREGRLRIGDKEIPVKTWLSDLEAKWASYWQGYWSEKMDD